MEHYALVVVDSGHFDQITDENISLRTAAGISRSFNRVMARRGVCMVAMDQPTCDELFSENHAVRQRRR